MSSTTLSMSPPIAAAASPERGRLWASRIISGLVSLFLAFDLIAKLIQQPDAVKATAELGFPDGTLVLLGAIQLVCLIAYLIPRTAVIGAVLWTGYLGGALATHLRTGGPAFSFVFPLLVAAMLWGGLYLRDARVAALLSPARRA
jgi:hypothetical protein